MRNPLNKRLPRELRDDIGKYIVIFIFMISLISLISGFLVSDISVTDTFDKGLEKYNCEDGHITFNVEPTEELISQLEEAGNLKFYDLKYVDTAMDNSKATMRVYINRTDIDLACVMTGSNPEKVDEIALDRMFAQNNNLSIGDSISLEGMQYTIVGLVAYVDYSSLFENNTDMMFDSINFGVATMSQAGFNKLSTSHMSYNYAWKYNDTPQDEDEENEKSEAFIDDIEDIIKAHDTEIIQVQVDALYDEADALSEDMEEEFQAAAKSIEAKIKEATIAAMMKGNPTQAQIAVELNTTEKTLSDMLDSLKNLEDNMADMENNTERKEINLDELEDSKDYENDMSFSLEPLENAVSKIKATGIYDTSRLEEIINNINALKDRKIDDSNIITVENYVPRYENQAINFTRDDMGSDKIMFTIFNYLVIVILAFVFAVTTSNTIAREAGVIGTLRASGYTRGELVRHYMVLPVAVTLVAAIIGNILGYTVFEKYFIDIYYNSYSLATYTTKPSAEAFIATTVVPIIIMLIINLYVLVTKFKLSPLRFLRHDISKKGRKKSIYLNKKIPFMHRFRIRILFQNVSAYITLALGIFMGSVITVFSLMFGPLLSDYSELVVSSRLADYQYVLMNQVKTDNSQAEKYCITTLDTEAQDYLTDEISVYGIERNSKYVLEDIPEDEVLVSNVFAEKYGLSEGDIFSLKEAYGDKAYSFTVGGIYKYDAALAVFMNRNDYINTFKEEQDYYSGYFSNEELTDIETEDVATVITRDDLTKVADQLLVSMGEFMNIFKIFGTMLFLLLMFLMTKQIIEKNSQSIAMTKILGFTTQEVGKLYLLMTSIVVLASLLVSMPLVDACLRWIFHSVIYTAITGYIPYIISNSCYIKTVALGMGCYILIACAMMVKINKIPKSDALKNVE